MSLGGGTTIRRYSVPAPLALLAVLGLYVASAFFIGLKGDFPLNDDWAYAGSVRSLIWGGSWRPSDWSAPALLTHSLWAAPFCAASSCSFESLRFSSFTASLLIILVSYLLLARAGASRPVAFTALVLIAFNPVGFELSYTFMTDTFFTMAMTVSLYFFVRSLEEKSDLFLVIAAVAAIVGILCRQIALCLPIAYAIVRLLQGGPLLRRFVSVATPLAVCILALFAFEEWMRATGRMPTLYNVPLSGLKEQSGDPTSLLMHIVRRVSILLLYVGLFSSPILLLTRSTRYSSTRFHWMGAFVSGLFVLISISRMVHLRAIMPLTDNVLVPEGLGPLDLRDTSVLQLPDVPPLPVGFWLAVTAISLAGQFLLVKHIASYLHEVWHRRDGLTIDTSDAGPFMALMTIIVYSSPLIFVHSFDRYYVPLLPPVLYWLIATRKMNSRFNVASAFAGVVSVGIVIYSIFGVHDYMQWNRARWEIITQLEKRKEADYRNIDGGFEYNGLRGFDKNYKQSADKSWWWVKDDEFVVAFAPFGQYSPVTRYVYRTLLPPDMRSVYLLKRQPAAKPNSQ